MRLYTLTLVFRAVLLNALLITLVHADVFENITGAASNSQGNLSYSVPLNFPVSINGLSPSLSVDYTPVGNGVLGSGFELAVSSQISRCAPAINSHGIQGGVETDVGAVYCLDGGKLKLINTSDKIFSLYLDSNIRLTAEGSLESPSQWIVNDAQGFIYRYFPVDNGVKAMNQSWYLKSKEDRFGNKITYTKNSDNTLKEIVYPGFKIYFSYKTSSYTNKFYNNGVQKEINQLLDTLTLYRSDVAIYKYDFSYESFSSYQTPNANRLKNIKKCYLINDGGECSKPITFEYEPVVGLDPTATAGYLPSIANTTNVFSKAMLEEHATLNEQKSLPAYHGVDLDNVNGEDVCFYSVKDQLVCAVADGDGTFTVHESYVSGFGYDIDNFSQYSALNFIDINHDGYVDLCIADDNGIQCAKTNADGVMASPVQITNLLNEETGYQFSDINRDGYLDVCGAVSNRSYQCFENIEDTSLKHGQFATVSIVNTTGQFSKNFSTVLSGYQEESEYYKKIRTQLMDINGDGILDLCNAPGENFSCLVGVFGSRNVLSFGGETYTSAYPLYLEVPYELTQMPYLANDIDETIDAFRIYKVKNENISLSVRLSDVNADGLTDLCYAQGRDFKCQLNTDLGFAAPTTWVSLDAGWQGHGVDALNSLVTAITLMDVNSDGLIDACLMVNDLHQCAYNTGSGFSEFKKRIQIVLDVSALEFDKEVYLNYIRKILSHELDLFITAAVNVSGNVLHMNDMNGDGLSEICMRTVNGVDCHSNEQQSYFNQLKSVTSSHGVKTKFTFSSNDPSGWYSSATSLPDDFIEVTPRQIVLTSMATDAGVNSLINAQYDTVTYEYTGYAYNPSTGEAGFSQITQNSSLNNKQQVTEYYLQDDLTGRVKKVTETHNGKTLSVATNEYDVIKTDNSLRIRTTKTTEQQFDPLAQGSALRTIRKEYSEFDALGYPQKTVETNAITGSSKVTTTDIVYQHDENLWILGRPESQTVTHAVTPSSIISPNISKKISFEYYAATMALHKQYIEPDSSYSKTIERIYYTNGTLQKELQTGKVNATDIQTRFNSYTYTDIGQQLSVTNALGLSSRVEYHSQCMAKEYEYDAKDRKVVTHTYNENCQLTHSTYSNGSVKRFVTQWDDSYIAKPAESTVDNYSLLLSQEFSNSGAQKWTYIDRLGRTVKALNSVSKTNTVEKNAVSFNHFNGQGQLIARSSETLQSSDILADIVWTKTGYDNYGRPNAVYAVAPDGNYYYRTISYNGLRTIETFNGENKISLVGVQGKVVFTSQYQKVMAYQYSAMGELVQTINEGNNDTAITIEYDEFGVKKKQTDPSMGVWTYKHNAFGELYQQTDAAKNVTTISYDVGGRKSSQTAPEGSSSWVYYTSLGNNGYGQLNYSLSVNGIKRLYTYDFLGRIAFEALFDGSTQVNKTQLHYDTIGRLKTTEYNQGASNSDMIMPLDQQFDLAGRLTQVLMPANKLKSYDHGKIEAQYNASLAAIAQLSDDRAEVIETMEYHAEQIVLYEAKVQGYSQLADSTLIPIIEHIEGAINEHQVLLGKYQKRYQDLEAKVVEDRKSVV